MSRILLLGASVLVAIVCSSSIATTAPAATSPAQAGPESWAIFATVPEQAYSSGAALDGKLYVLGGIFDAGSNPPNSRSYDPATGTWTDIAQMNHPRAGASTASIDGRLYVVGGWGPFGCVREVEAYDPIADTWTAKSAFPDAACDRATAAVVGTKIYQFGGRDSNTGLMSDAVFEYDTVTDVWSARPDLTMPRPLQEASAVALDNHVFIFGGVSLNNVSNSAVLDLDLTRGTWTVREHGLSRSRAYSGVAVRDGRIYLMGGFPLDYAQTVAIYHPALDSFADGPPLIVPRVFAAAAVVGMDIYVIGGGYGAGAPTTAEVLKGQGPPCFPGGYLASPSDTYCSWAPAGSYVSEPGATSATLCAPGTYSAATGATSCTQAPPGMVITTSGATAPTACPGGFHASADATACLPTIRWSPMPDQLPSPPYGTFTAELGGKLYVMGRGVGGLGGSVQSYEPLTGTWAAVAPMLHPRIFAGAAVANGKLYVIGGVTESWQPEPAVEEYDPVTNTWTERSPFPEQNVRRYSATVAVGSKIYVLGGVSSVYAESNLSVLVYDASADSWSSSPGMDLPVGPLGLTHAAAVNNHIYLVGGERHSVDGGYQTDDTIDSVWDLDLATESWSRRADLPTPRTWMGVAARDGLIYLVGGRVRDVGDVKTVDVYDPAHDSFSAGPELTHPRFIPVSTTVGRRIYTVGQPLDSGYGGSQGQDFTNMEVLLDAVETPPCLPGKYLASPTDPACTMAPPGSFVGTLGATSATLCAPGSYSDWFGAIKCVLAPYGTFANGEGSTGVMIPTEAGRYLSGVVGATSIPCAPGSYADRPGLFACIPAPRGTFVSGSGAIAPTACPEGTGSRPGWATCAPIPPGTSLRFSGGQAVQLNDVGSVRTVAAWVKRAPDGGGPIVSQWGPSGNNTFQFVVEVGADGHVYASLRSSRRNQIATLASFSTIDPDTWTHVTVGFTDSTIAIYVNGVLDNAESPFLNVFPNTVSSARLLIGASDSAPPGGDQFFDGQIADVKIWADYGDPASAAFDCDATGDVHLPLDEGSGTIVALTSAGWDGLVTSELLGDPLPVWADDGPAATAFCGPDTTPPTISASDVTAIANDPAGAMVSFAPGATDDSGIVTVSCTPASPALLTIGAHDVACTATDRAGNSASAAFAVNVLDGVPPTISLPVVAAVEATSSGGASVTFSVSATDNLPGPVTMSCSSASGALFAIRTTPVSCTATDAAGNTSLPAIFNVVVRDTTPPVIDAHAAMTAMATTAAGAVVTYVSPATHDVVDAAGTATCTPASGKTFLIGATTVTCTAADAHGNVATPTTFVVTVLDGVPPTMSVPTLAPVEATSSGGAVVTFSVSATDNVPGPVTVACSATSGALFAIGTTPVSCTATDAAGNISLPAIVNIVVRDTTPPTIDAPAAMSATATSAAGAVVTYASPATHDIVDPAGTATCTPASGKTFAIGATTVTCTATDAHGNAATPTTFVVTVSDVTTPGSMHGEGKVKAGDDRYQFNFEVREQARGERGKFALEIDYAKRPGPNDKKGKPTSLKPEDGRFRSTAITFVAFSDDPTIRPGRSPKPQIDTVSFAGTGEWNGRRGYTFEIKAVDQGEPGRHRESIAIVIRDSAGQVVAQASGVLDSGNVQSTRIKH